MNRWNEYNSCYIDGLLHVPVTFPFNRPDGLLISDLQLNQLISYANENDIKKFYVEKMTHFDFINNLSNAEHLVIEFDLPRNKLFLAQRKRNKFHINYNLSLLSDMRCLRSLSFIINEHPYIVPHITADLSSMPQLEKYSGNYSAVFNLEKATSLKTLSMHHFDGEHLTKFERLENIDTLNLSLSKIKSLKGLDSLYKMQCLYLSYNRNLTTIQHLSSIKNTLKSLRIENCPNINDFSVFEELHELELLELSGNYTLPSIRFIKRLKKLKTLILDVDIADGDLSPCLNLSYVHLGKNRKHFNLKDRDLPKNQYIRGNECVDEWRRLE